MNLGDHLGARYTSCSKWLSEVKTLTFQDDLVQKLDFREQCYLTFAQCTLLTVYFHQLNFPTNRNIRFVMACP